MDVFHREALAAEMAGKILSLAATSASSSGIFLAAPRRTGKSTFLREDLRPQLARRDVLVIYADLWEDRRADPGDVLINAVRAELAKHDSVMRRLARSVGMEKVAVGGVSFALDKIGLGTGISLSAALSALSDGTRKLIAFIVDEAQHAITSDKGIDALFALKAARDELNSSQHHGLRIVATGSNRDKLTVLRSSRDQAFFGAPLVTFPVLGEDYVRWFCERADLGAPLDPPTVMKLFERASYRPEILAGASDAVRFSFGIPVQEIPARFAAAVDEQIVASNAELMRVVHSLTPLQAAVLRTMGKKGVEFAPFEAATIKAYQSELTSNDVKVDVTNVQQALLALQEKALVWRAARGVYSLEEPALAELMSAETYVL